MTTAERRIAGGLAVASTVCNTAVLALIGSPPKVGSVSNGDVARWLFDHRGAALGAAVLATLAVTASLGFFAGLRGLVGRGAALGDAGLVAAALTFAIVAVGAVALGTGGLLMSSAAKPSPEFAHAVMATLFMTFALSAAPTLLLVGAFAPLLLRSDEVPRWVGWGFVGVGVVHVGALVSVARTGWLSPQGLFAIGAPVLYEAWQLLTGLALLRPGKVVTPDA